jgi:hypothetical protein
MEKRKWFVSFFCLILCYSLFQHTAIAQSSSQISIFSQGNITYSPSNVNLAVIPDDWYLTYGSGPQIIHLDYNVYRTSPPSIRLDPHVDDVDVNYQRECDGKWYTVKPGDRIVAKCWIFCGDSGIGDTDPYNGARLGMDLYAHTSQGYGIVDSYPHDGQEHLDSEVNWGTKTWTQKVWDIIVPSTYYTTVWVMGKGFVTCDPVQIDSFVLWLDVRTRTDPGLAWFDDAELYINPP